MKKIFWGRTAKIYNRFMKRDHKVYIICGNRDEYLKEQPEYVDEQRFKRNK